MATIIKYSMDFYISHLPLILLFSLSFVIAFLIPLFASFPTYNDGGAIFIRLASLFINLNPFTTAVILFSTLFSLLFLSFAIVAINIIVRHSRTGTRMTKEVMEGLEKHTASVFTVLLIFTAIIALVSTLVYSLNLSPIITSVVALAITPFFFYAPASIVIDGKSVMRSLGASEKFFIKELKYPVLWVAVAIVLITVFDFLFIAIGGTALSRYLLLGFNSLFILPFLVVLQSQAYMRRFPLLKR